MPKFDMDEITLMALYDKGSRNSLIAALKEMRPYLDEDEKALQDMTDAVLEKLTRITDEQYSELMCT